ncbi:MAG: hypothetical protein O6950_02035 [Gammaproteobacteria bacterium]|nr:hypothetical protein [Gammaproteobacteria bacterium]
MFSLLTFFLGLIINVSKSKKQLLAQISLQQKELEMVKAPNMNAIAERFIGSVRREALDYFLLISEQQI